MTGPVYTIGHSTHPIGRLIELLSMHPISAVCDVRSTPYSRMNPQFNRETLRDALRDAGIEYVFLGRELGARTTDQSCYRDGQVQYDLLARTKPFQDGIARVKQGAQAYRIALMCAEKEPLDCHRTILIARRLVDDGLTIRHILPDGRIEDHAQTIERLVARRGTAQPDMFGGHDTVLADAYARRAYEIAYRADT